MSIYTYIGIIFWITSTFLGISLVVVLRKLDELKSIIQKERDDDIEMQALIAEKEGLIVGNYPQEYFVEIAEAMRALKTEKGKEQP